MVNVIFFLTEFLDRVFFKGFRTHVVATTVCTTGEEYVHSPVARTFFLHIARAQSHSHIFMLVTYTHGSSVCKKVCAYVCRISPSRHLCLMSHPSSLFPHGHFETTPDYDFTDDPVHTFLPHIPVLKSAGHAQLRTSTEEFGYLAKSGLNTCATTDRQATCGGVSSSGFGRDR